ncbi:DUF4270 family protein [Aquimarina gracilis]|uniref:DUF4270 family protein n=1 Tax=Aquimarina gracilis TaxID=874422 RepID=A0ABU5ZYQ4_9FLAO|nr:DUF4270 family protein [Aquimarina gracilis]MEB3347008.1 DUF4270 family protein [Aquimarina gracilis]
MKSFLFLFCLFLFVVSCSEREDIPTLEVGQDFTNSNVRIISIDTFTVELSTYKFDSIITSSSNRILIGQYRDSIFGITRSESYMELLPTNYSIDDDAELDSIALILNYDGYSYSDTTKTSSINVHLLKDEVRPNEDAFFNTSSIAFDEIPISTINFLPEPTDEDSLYIPIPIVVGQELFDKIQKGDVNDENEVRNELKGFALQPGNTDDSSIIGFSVDGTQSYLRFFYTIRGEFEDNEQTFDLVINSTPSFPTYFNNIQSNTEGTFFNALTDQEINLPSDEANNRSYIQAGVGMVTRIQFPTIKKISEIPGTGTILDATLKIKPPPSTFTDFLPIKDSLSVNNSDQNNIIGSQLFNGAGEVFANINENDREFNEITYEVEVGVHLENELSEAPEIDNAIILFPLDFNNTVDRIVLEGENSNDFAAKLIITYAIYDEEE